MAEEQREAEDGKSVRRKRVRGGGVLREKRADRRGIARGRGLEEIQGASALPKDLDQALSSFNRLQPDTARRVLGFFRTRVKKPAPPTVPPAVAVNG